ncbi:lipase maturation factor 1 isoform X2 [Nematostella vectensis]|uniref:lipase maturation factor 1 isoform X2 n=1 Tax=Nematostella vectensis TaxID=45351 RepID=UPI00207775F9|nr:lipase maturation factor 1 isoform X2 [Nematostella vectensis]
MVNGILLLLIKRVFRLIRRTIHFLNFTVTDAMATPDGLRHRFTSPKESQTRNLQKKEADVVAFTIAANQNRQLLGKDGLLPSDMYLKRIKQHFSQETEWKTFLHVPTLLLFTDPAQVDQHLDVLAYTGLAVSAFILLTGCANMIMMFALWLVYHSIVNVGQRWYSFGWESQLLESGFLATFLCPVFKLQQVPAQTPIPLVVIYGYRWLIFRIMLGAGLIKIRGDQCWRDLTCMNYHYETQPVPNPISYYMHHSPELFHKFETLVNHFVELVAPFLLFLPRPLRIWGGLIQIAFQVILIISGNLSFLNWLTILPSIACFDDSSLAWLFSSFSGARIKVQEIQKAEKEHPSKPTWGLCVRRTFEIMLGLVLAYLSIPVVQNLLSTRQAMNTSFDSFRLVNTYGAFGSITKERTEVIFQGTRNRTIIPDDQGGIWQEYEFKCKPGSVARRPCLISPYHYRLDWLMWFAAFQNYQYNPWLIHLAAKLLANDEQATSLIAHNPFGNGTTPMFIRGEHYRYTFAEMGSAAAERGQWWQRTRIGSYFPPVTLRGLRAFLKAQDWELPKLKTNRNEAKQ